MELTELRNKIVQSFTGSNSDLQVILTQIENDHCIFPFNEYEYLICSLINKGGLTYEKYTEIRQEYIAQNPNMWIFEISAPRGFGEKFAQTYLQGKCEKLIKPTKKVDPTYSGEYDLLLNTIKIEVKASRATDSTSNAPLYMKALSKNTTRPFLMNFQQLKPQMCDVFIWVAVFRDAITLWIMNSDEVKNNPHYSKGQHRGNKGNEGQLHIKEYNINDFKKYELGNQSLEHAIRDAFARI